MIGSVNVKEEAFVRDTGIQNKQERLIYDSKIGAKVFQGWKRYEEAEEEE